MNTSPPSRRERREADAAGPTRGPGRAGRRRPVEKPDGTPPAPAPDQVAGASQDTGASQPPASRAARKQPAAGPGRAGRNLPAAIGVGVGLGAVIVASLFIRKEAFLAVAVLAVCTGVWELSHGLSAGRIRVPLLPSVVGAATMVVAAYKGGGQALTVAFGLTCVAVLLWRVADGLDDAMRDIAGGIFVAAYVPLLAGFASLMLADPDGPWRIFVFVLVTVCSDVGGYAVGVVLGKHPMAPSVSPKKSWEGFAGSTLFCVVGGIFGVTLALHAAWWVGAVLGLAAVVTATLGDLTESMIKRDLGIKDMGTLLPGHGGVMDRLDSLLLVAPVVWALLTAFVPAR
ncbi:MAG: phosphatidate cytidylyltransferase [Oryzihumus sp.]